MKNDSETFNESLVERVKQEARECFEGIQREIERITGKTIDQLREQAIANLSPERRRQIDKKVRLFLEKSDHALRRVGKPHQLPKPSKKIKIPL